MKKVPSDRTILRSFSVFYLFSGHVEAAAVVVIQESSRRMSLGLLVRGPRATPGLFCSASVDNVSGNSALVSSKMEMLLGPRKHYQRTMFVVQVIPTDAVIERPDSHSGEQAILVCSRA